VTTARELLRQLAASGHVDDAEPALDRQTRALVQLAALVAVDASTPALRCTAERAAATGVRDEALVHVLLAAARAAGAAQMVRSAPRLALALDVDIER